MVDKLLPESKSAPYDRKSKYAYNEITDFQPKNHKMKYTAPFTKTRWIQDPIHGVIVLEDPIL
jgi:hypothetical protein